MKSITRETFYLFKGDWRDIFRELQELFPINSRQTITIWEPRDKTKTHNLLILSDKALPDQFCLIKKIWKTDRKIFDSFYKNHRDKFKIYSE